MREIEQIDCLCGIIYDLLDNLEGCNVGALQTMYEGIEMLNKGISLMEEAE